MDPLDLLREYYRAFNRAEVNTIADRHAPDCSVDGLLPLAGDQPMLRSREEVRAALRRFFEEYDGGFDGGARLRVRTLAGIETGWVHVEWIASHRRRATGEPIATRGYNQFLIEQGLIQQQRGVVLALDTLPADEPPMAAGPLPRASRRYPTRPIVGVGAVIVNDGRVVLIKRRYEPLAGQWSLPGGSLEVGETLEAGTAREVLEETGLVVEVGPVVDVFDRIQLDERRRVRYHFVLIDYLCWPVGGELRAGSDVTDVVLAGPGELEPYRLTPKALEVIRKGLALWSRERRAAG